MNYSDVKLRQTVLVVREDCHQGQIGTVNYATGGWVHVALDSGLAWFRPEDLEAVVIERTTLSPVQAVARSFAAGCPTLPASETGREGRECRIGEVVEVTWPDAGGPWYAEILYGDSLCSALAHGSARRSDYFATEEAALAWARGFRPHSLLVKYRGGRSRNGLVRYLS